MGKWIHSQFEAQFFEYERSACADIMHVAGYLIDAGRVIAGLDKAVAGAWEEKNAPLMLALVAIRASGWWDDFWK